MTEPPVWQNQGYLKLTVQQWCAFLQDPSIFGENALRMVEFVYWQANHDRDIPIHFSLRLMLETDVSLLPRGVSRKHINSKKSLNANSRSSFLPRVECPCCEPGILLQRKSRQKPCPASGRAIYNAFSPTALCLQIQCRSFREQIASPRAWGFEATLESGLAPAKKRGRRSANGQPAAAVSLAFSSLRKRSVCSIVSL